MRSRFARRLARIGTIILRALGRDNITNQSIASVTKVEKIGSHYGGWVVPVDLLNRDSICYCAGVGEDATFDIGLIRRFGCNVYAMDPTPRAIAYAQKVAQDVQRFRFVPVGLWDSDSEVQFFAPRDPKHVSHSAMNLQRNTDFFVGKCRRLRNLMVDHGHEQLTLLKLDVEGAEYKVIDSIIEDRILIQILCVEFDEINWPLDDRFRERIRETVRKLSSIGYRIIAVDGSANYTFLKLDADCA